MSAIGVGDWVESIRDNVSNWDDDRLQRGQLYLVIGVDEYDDGCSDCGKDRGVMFDLKGHEDPDRGWCACSFRPVYRSKSEIIRKLLAPTPAEREPVEA